MSLLFNYFISKLVINPTEDFKFVLIKTSNEYYLKSIVTISNLLCFIGYGFMFSGLYLVETFGELDQDQVIYFLTSKKTGGGSQHFVMLYIYEYFIYVLEFTFIHIVVHIVVFPIELKFSDSTLNIGIEYFNLFIFIFGIINFSRELNLKDNLKLGSSTFFEEEYINPRNVNITFPDQKRNILLVLLESYESTYMDKSHGGCLNHSALPLLTSLIDDPSNLHFSNTDKYGGGYQTHGATWTVGAHWAIHSGTPLKVPFDGNQMNRENSFMGLVYTLSEILMKHGYDLSISASAQLSFGGLVGIYKSHGKWDMYDYDSMREKGYYPSKYKVFWGIEDSRLFNLHETKVLPEVIKRNKPFFSIVKTNDCHFPNGYQCPLCKNEFDEPFLNSMKCQDRLAYNFVQEIKKKPYYENTTIILLGDHLMMGKHQVGQLRTIYNIILNPIHSCPYTKNRTVMTFDWFPTLISLAGGVIEGNKLGLGTNLLSGEKTIGERFGPDYVNEELSKYSKYYFDNIYEASNDGPGLFTTIPNIEIGRVQWDQ